MSDDDRRVGPCGKHCAVVDECEARGDVIRALRAENARLQKENWEYVARSYALINMLPDETMAGEIQDARRVFGGIVEALRAENARLREDLARMFEELPETTWTSKDVAYVIRNYTARTAMGENDE